MLKERKYQSERKGEKKKRKEKYTYWGRKREDMERRKVGK